MSNLDAFFRPRGVALIGASADPAKLGGRRYRTLVEGNFTGCIFPVNPRASEIRGHRAYASIDDVPDPVDLAVIMVRSDRVLESVAACARRAVPAVMVITAGFGEVGPAGIAAEREMVDLLAPHGGRLMGPNCAGLFDAAAGLNIGGLAVPPGPIGLVSQSGNLVLDFARHAAVAGSGLSRYAAIGNAADVRPIDVIENLLDDDATSVVLAYVEGWSDGEGRRLHDLVRNHPSAKPVVILKPGRSEAGRSAALSHTGSLAGEDRIVEAAFRQAGIWRATNAGAAWDAASTLARYAPLASNQVVILTDGGGHATLLADALGLRGLAVPPLDDTTRSRLRAFLPERCAVGNPVDFAGVAEERPGIWIDAATVCREVPGVGAVALVGHFGGYHDNGGADLGVLETAAGRDLAALCDSPGAPLFVHSIHAQRGKPALEALTERRLSVFRAPHELAQALAALDAASVPRRATVESDTPRNAAAMEILESASEVALGEPDARAFLAAAGVDVPQCRVHADPLALAGASTSDGPVALKLVAPGLVHRTDAGCVILGVEGETAVETAARSLLERADAMALRHARVMSTPMIAAGIETVFGAVRDPHFGPVLMFGLGGIHLDALDDVVFRLAPITQREAFEMLGEIRAHSLLEGHRGAAPANHDAATSLLVRLGEVLDTYPEVAEIDLNPVILHASGHAVADARVILTGVQ